MKSSLSPKGNHSLVHGERVIRQMHPHPALLVKPTLGAVVLSLALYYVNKLMYFWFPSHSGKIDLIFILAYIIFLFPWVLVPYIKWATTMYLFTDQRIITRTGLIRISGEAIPLSKINSISFTKSFMERLYGSGSLVIESAASDAAVIKHVRGAENITNEVYQLITELKKD